MSKQTVLVADDEEIIRRVFSGMLEREGLEVVTASDGQEALDRFHEVKPDLVLLDIMMPKLNGLQVCEQLKNDPDNRLTPIVMVTASSAPENRLKGLEAGADEFLSKPVDRAELTVRVRSLLRLKRYTDELERAENVLCALAESIEGKDPYTRGHCDRLSINSVRLAKRIGLGQEQLIALKRAGIVHDIGKVAVPDAVLLKKGKLDADDLVIMRQHTIVGEKICHSLKSFTLVLPIIRHHHEKLDGTGYPDGLKGDAIPITARVMQIIDVFDALTTERPYKDAMSDEKALAIMQSEVEKGWWDPALFEEFCKLVAEEGFDKGVASVETEAVPATV